MDQSDFCDIEIFPKLFRKIQRVDEKEESPRAGPWGRGKSGIDMWNYAASPSTVLGTHTHSVTHSAGGRNKETVSRAQLAPSAGGRGGQKYPLKGYIPRDIYSLRRRLGFQTSSTGGSNYNVFDGSTNTPGSVAVDLSKE